MKKTANLNLFDVSNTRIWSFRGKDNWYLQIKGNIIIKIAKSKEVFDFFNSDGTFNLTLSFDIQKNENLLDSLLELRKSIIINERI